MGWLSRLMPQSAAKLLATRRTLRQPRLASDEAVKIAAASDGAAPAIFLVPQAGRLADINLDPVFNSGLESAITGTAAAALQEAEALFKLHRVNGRTRAIDAHCEEIAPALKRAALNTTRT